MSLVTLEYFEDRFPRPLETSEKRRLNALLSDAEDIIRGEFAKSGRDLDGYTSANGWATGIVQRVIFSMVSAAILVGVNAGVRSVSSATGPISDSITYADVNSSAWGGVVLTPLQRSMLGLANAVGPRGIFPAQKSWPEQTIDR